MWSFKSTVLNNNVYRFTLYDDNVQQSFSDVINSWVENKEFRGFYFSILQQSPFEAFFWENPPVTSSTSKQAYEFVLVNSPQLARVSVDASSFQDKFKSSNNTVIAFENLGRDAELIVPCPIAAKDAYTHLASFIRNAPEDQKHDLFARLADSLKRRINNQPTWLSTSGLGVYWLHIRLDTKPKYYSYQPYRNYVEK